MSAATPVGAPRRFADLSPRQRECLRLVFELKTSKDIERELGIAKNTIDGYLAEAVRTLDARDRKHAARLLAEHENRGVAALPEVLPQVSSGDDPARVARSTDQRPFPLSPGRSGDGRSLLPLRRKGGRGNPLTPGERALWIVLLAVLMMIGFGMLVSGLAVLTGIFEAIGLVKR